MITKDQFENAILFAVKAESQNSRKWKRLESLFAAEQLRVSGALFNEVRQGGNRAQQLFDSTRRHNGFADRGSNKHSIVVFNKALADDLRRSPSDLTQRWVPEIEANRPSTLSPAQSADSVLFIRVDGNDDDPTVVPLALLCWAKSDYTKRLRIWYPALEIIDRPATYGAPSDDAVIRTSTAATDSDHAQTAESPRNVIYSGPPGTGKSFEVKAATEGFVVFQVTFHPEIGYGQFVGEYKPVVGMDASATITGFDGNEIQRPVSYYAFEPGVVARALVQAAQKPDSPVAVVVEEINRGDCAAIFGDMFQLLDRSLTGESEYSILPTAAFAKFLVDGGVLPSTNTPLRLPSNLFFFATMNTSDQSLFPMDAAFRRRWDWRTLSVSHGIEKLKDVYVQQLGGDSPPLRWVDLVMLLNERIMARTLEDKRIGPWVIRPRQGKVLASQIREQLLHLLWHDVFRMRRDELFDTTLRTFDDVQAMYDQKGLLGVMPRLFMEREDSRAAEAASLDTDA